MRNLLLFFLLLVAVWWIRRALRNLRGGPGANQARRGGGSHPEAMLACKQCGIHVPESEGVRDGEAFYCCDEHRRQAGRR